AGKAHAPDDDGLYRGEPIVAVPVKSVPPPGRGWVPGGNVETHPLPRGGTDPTGTATTALAYCLTLTV
ncbi:MAG: hypothetical protein ABR557_14150, partial [Pyrinomonadaceae bacterium]